MPKFKKGSKEARELMAKLRAKRGKTATKKAAPKKKRIGTTQGNLFSQKPKPKQRGTSNLEADKRRKAKAPGKRKTESGSTYYESRRNRSDIPGTMAGIGSINKDLKQKLTSAEYYLSTLVGRLAFYTQLYKTSKNKSHKEMLPKIRKQITEAKKVVTKLKKVAK